MYVQCNVKDNISTILELLIFYFINKNKIKYLQYGTLPMEPRRLKNTMILASAAAPLSNSF